MDKEVVSRKKVLKEMEQLYLRAINSGESKWVDVYTNLIVEYILKKCEI
jgi:hypothetical protein